jgi:hypothetical protein
LLTNASIRFNFDFNFNLRRYTVVVDGYVPGAGLGAAVRELAGWRLAGGYGWAVLAAAVLTAVGRCRSTHG